jgi:hypothetical protein
MISGVIEDEEKRYRRRKLINSERSKETDMLLF